MHSPVSFAGSPSIRRRFTPSSTTSSPFSHFLFLFPRPIFLARAISTISSHSMISSIGFNFLWDAVVFRFRFCGPLFQLLNEPPFSPWILKSPANLPLGTLCSISAVILLHFRSLGVLITLLSSQPSSILLIRSSSIEPTRSVSAQLSFLLLLFAPIFDKQGDTYWFRLAFFLALVPPCTRAGVQIEIFPDECRLSLSLHSQELVPFLVILLLADLVSSKMMESRSFEYLVAGKEMVARRLLCFAIPFPCALPRHDLWSKWCAFSDSSSSLFNGISLKKQNFPRFFLFCFRVFSSRFRDNYFSFLVIYESSMLQNQDSRAFFSFKPSFIRERLENSAWYLAWKNVPQASFYYGKSRNAILWDRMKNHSPITWYCCHIFLFPSSSYLFILWRIFKLKWCHLYFDTFIYFYNNHPLIRKLMSLIDDKQILSFSTILNSLIILTLKKRNHRHHTHDKLSYKLIIQCNLYVQMSMNYGTKLWKDLEIKITHDKVSKNIVNRFVSYLDDQETEKQDRAPLREAPRAHRVSTEAKRQWWYRRPKQIKKKRWRQACSHDWDALSQHCRVFLSLLPPSPPLDPFFLLFSISVVSYPTLSLVLVIFARVILPITIQSICFCSKYGNKTNNQRR